MKYVVRFGNNGYFGEDDDDATQCNAIRFDSVEEAWLAVVDNGYDGQGARVLRLKPKAPRVPLLYANFRGGDVTGVWDTKEGAETATRWGGDKPDELAVPLYR